MDFFWNPVCDSSFGNSVGEGRQYLGSATGTTNGSGNLSFNVSFSGSPSNGVVSSTATDSNNNTSEFSYCATITSGTAVPPAPQLLTPSKGESVGSNPPWLDWSDSNGATYYKLTIRQDIKKGVKVYVNPDIKVSEHTPPSALAGGHKYFWFVNACNSAGCQKSPVFNFYIP
jgi:hypothetical protein